MARIFTVTGKAPIVNANLYSETSPEDSILVCLSKRDVFIIRSYLWPFVEWRTRFAMPIVADKWQETDESEFEEFLTTCNELDGKLSGGDFMTCLDTGLLAVADAIRLLANSQCCDTVNVTVNGGVVSQWTDGDGVSHPIYGTHDPVTNDGVTPPDGFETYEDYLLNKCQIANLVFDGWLLTLRGISGFTVFNATALATLLGLALAGIIAFPPAAIPVMVGLLIVLGIEITVLGDIADELQAHKFSIVCDLYESDTVESMTAILSDALDVAIAALSLTGIVGETAKAVALLLVNSDTLSQLLSGVAGASYPDADCSACGCDVVFSTIESTQMGTGDLTPDGTSRTITASHISSGYIIQFAIDCECSPDGMLIAIDDLGGYVAYTGGGTGDPGDKGGGIVDCSEAILWQYFSGAPVGPYQCRLFQLGPQNDPFSVDLTITV